MSRRRNYISGSKAKDHRESIYLRVISSPISNLHLFVYHLRKILAPAQRLDMSHLSLQKCPREERRFTEEEGGMPICQGRLTSEVIEARLGIRFQNRLS